MDLDRFYTEFRAFRDRVEPMLAEHEERKRAEAEKQRADAKDDEPKKAE